MQKNQLLKNQKNEIIRILAIDGDEVLYIFCNKEKKCMPKWARRRKIMPWPLSSCGR